MSRNVFYRPKIPRRKCACGWALAAAFLGCPFVVRGQPSATRLLTIPCTLVVPGNQQKADPVYGLTECYHATVCIDQPVASDVIRPPPTILPSNRSTPSATPQALGIGKSSPREVSQNKRDVGGIESPFLGSGVESDNQPIEREDIPALEPEMGSSRSRAFGIKPLRGSGDGNMYGGQKEVMRQEKDKAEASSTTESNEWDFRRQRFRGSQIGMEKDIFEGDTGKGGSTGFTGQEVSGRASLKDAAGAVAESVEMKDDDAADVENPQDVGQGEEGAGTVPGTGIDGDPDVTGLDPGPDAGDNGSNDNQADSTTSEVPSVDIPTPSPDPAAPPDVADLGLVGEIAIVRVCSREVVCQECGPVNVVPRCTCSLVLYNPLTDPDYFLK